MSLRSDEFNMMYQEIPDISLSTSEMDIVK